MGGRSTSTMDTSDVYEAYVKPKDVKNKWIQTEEIDEGKRSKLGSNCIPKILEHTCSIKLPIFKSLIVTCSCMVQAVSPQAKSFMANHGGKREHRWITMVKCCHPRRVIVVSLKLSVDFCKTDERALVASDVYTGFCEGKMGSPMSMRNDGFSDDNETIKETKEVLR